MINFYLPEFFFKYDLNMTFINLFKSNPELFYDDINITAIYGTFPGAIWNGGRCMSGTCTKENMENTIKTINDLGVAVRYTFTNCRLNIEDTYDRYCNLMMEVGNNGMNEVLVNSDILEVYLHEMYPKYPIISSTTKRLTEVDEVLDEVNSGRYKLVVLDYIFNNTDELFTGELSRYSDKFEILLNAYCQDDCPMRSRHYRQLSEQQLQFTEDTPDFQACCHIGDDFYTVMETRKRFIKVEDLYGKYKDAGYQHFKIEGRTNSIFDVFESYLYYMVRPENHDKMRLKILNGVYGGRIR